MGAITRLAAMPGTNRLPPFLALLFVLAALSACGSDEIDGEIPPDNAVELNASLDDVRAAVESSQDCATAESAADQFVAAVNDLPATAGADLKEALQEAGGNLRVLVDQQCASTGATVPSGPEPTSSSTTSSETTTTSSTTDTTSTTTTTTSTDETQPQGNGNGGGPPGPSGNGPPGNGGTGGTGGGTGDGSDK